MSDGPENDRLSPEAIARRDAMLPGLLAHLRQTRRRRRRVRQVLSIAGAASIVLLVLKVAPHGASIAPLAMQPTIQPIAPPGIVQVVAASLPTRTVFVETDPSVVHRLRAEPASLVSWIDDDSLVEVLASIRRPAGLVRLSGHVRLTAAVTDEEIALRQ